MTDAPPDPGAPTPRPPSGPDTTTPTERVPWKAVLIMCLGGIALAVGGCGTFVSALNRNEVLGMAGGVAFVVGALLFAVGALTALVILLMASAARLRARS